MNKHIIVVAIFAVLGIMSIDAKAQQKIIGKDSLSSMLNERNHIPVLEIIKQHKSLIKVVMNDTVLTSMQKNDKLKVLANILEDKLSAVLTQEQIARITEQRTKFYDESQNSSSTLRKNRDRRRYKVIQ